MKTTAIGIIGCGYISGIYIQNILRTPHLRLAALADIDPARPLAKLEEIRAQASASVLPRACTVDELLADPAIDIVLNLTIPSAHAEVALQALAAGKHTYHEKPFALSVGEGRQILAAAKSANRRVAGFATATRPTRTITSEKRCGTIIRVETPTHFATSLEFESGALGTMIMSFDIVGTHLPRIEIYGTHGSLSCPDPNTFGGEVQLKIEQHPWQTVPLTHPHRDNAGGLGLTDLAEAIHEQRDHRANERLGFHILEVMEACLTAARIGSAITIASTVERPTAMPT